MPPSAARGSPMAARARNGHRARMRHVLFIGIALITGCIAADDGADLDESTTADEVSSPPGPYFTTSMFWNRDVSTAAKASTSDTIINSLKNAGGWGNGNVMQIDFALDVVKTTSTTPKRTFTRTEDWYNPDCDHVAMPVPAGGNLEDESGYACTGDGDCHLLVWDATGSKLYEMFRADIAGSTF